MKKNLLIITLACLTIITACQTPQNKATVSLHDTEWTVNKLNNVVVLPKNHPSISFTKNFRIQGNTSCNNYTGSYILLKNTIKISQIVSTKRACFSNDVMQQEQRLIQIIGQSQTWKIQTNGDLILTGTHGQLVASRK